MNSIVLADLINPNANVSIILPELVVALAGIVAIIYDSFFPKQRRVTGIVSLIGLVVSAVILATMWTGTAGLPASAWNGMIAHDNLRMAFSLI